MMAFITRSFKNGWLKQTTRWICLCVWLVWAGLAQAQTWSEVSQLKTERADNDILVSAQVYFDLPSAVDDALQKGIPLYFVHEAEILRERWYWYDKKISKTERHIRLAYQPLTRRWRLTTSSGAARGGSLGLSLNQNFETMEQALATLKRISRWKIADTSELDSSLKYRVEYRFRLDLSQLPLPFQIGALGQSNWIVSVNLQSMLSLDESP